LAESGTVQEVAALDQAGVFPSSTVSDQCCAISEVTENQFADVQCCIGGPAVERFRDLHQRATLGKVASNAAAATQGLVERARRGDFNMGIVDGIRARAGYSGAAGGLLGFVTTGSTEKSPCAEDSEVYSGDDPCLRNCEVLMHELFGLHDLDGNGTLEEIELIKLNEKIAMLHYGKDTDKIAIEQKYRDLFRSKLDPNGEAVGYLPFRRYLKDVLDSVDTDPNAHEMMLEQFIAEAQTGRQMFGIASMSSISDAPFLANLNFDDRPLAKHVKRVSSLSSGNSPFEDVKSSAQPFVPDDGDDLTSPTGLAVKTILTL